MSGMSAGVGRKVLHPKGESETTMRAIAEHAVTHTALIAKVELPRLLRSARSGIYQIPPSLPARIAGAFYWNL